MEMHIKQLFIYYSNQSENDVLLEFDYEYSDSVNYFYSFLRPIDESLDMLFKRIVSKISKIKYRKCSKKIKNHPFIDSCVIKAVDSSTYNELISAELSIKNLFSMKISIIINEIMYCVSLNPPRIKHCYLPKICIVDCPIYPIFEAINAENVTFNFQWYRGKSKTTNEWIECGSDSVLIPSHEFVNCFIKLKILSSIIISNQIFSVISNNAVENFPQTPYQLSMVFDKANVNGNSDDESFTMCTYNILSHIYAETPQAKKVLYRHCDRKYLSHDYRQSLILGELLSQRSNDLIFLQEVDQSFFLQSLQPILKYFNYDCIYQNKSKNNLEGQAIFWKKNKFKLVENISIACLSDELIKNEAFCEMKSILSDTNLIDKWQSMGQCMTGCVLETVDFCSTSKRLILSNNHLFFHPKFEIFRLLQVAIVCDRLEQLKREYNEAVCIIGGDFNASFEDESIRFVLENQIQLQYEDKLIKLEHGLKNLSVVHKGVVEFSNFTPDYVGLLDHVIIDSTEIGIKLAYNVPTRAEIEENIALPNKFHPSDHLPLYCDISFL